VLLFFNLGAKWGWVFNVTLRTLDLRRSVTFSPAQKSGLASRPVSKLCR